MHVCGHGFLLEVHRRIHIDPSQIVAVSIGKMVLMDWSKRADLNLGDPSSGPFKEERSMTGSWLYGCTHMRYGSIFIFLKFWVHSILRKLPYVRNVNNYLDDRQCLKKMYEM